MSEFLTQDGNDHNVTFRVGPDHYNTLTVTKAENKLHITLAEFVLAVGETARLWFHKNHTLRNTYPRVAQAVKIDEHITDEDRTVASVPIEVITQSRFVNEHFRLRYTRDGIEVRMRVIDFSFAAMAYLEHNPRLPMKGLHPAIERNVRFHWDNLVYEMQEKTRERA